MCFVLRARAEETTPSLRDEPKAPVVLPALFFARITYSIVLMSWLEWLVISGASAMGGFVDAIVGGGGLVLVPALFATFPNTHPATLFGVNKGSSMWGTAAASAHYARHVRMPWSTVGLSMACAFAASMVGAWVVTQIQPDVLRKVLPVILVAVLIYTLVKKELGRHHAPRLSARHERVWMMGIATVVGGYDGFFGPGTGSFFVILLVRVLGYDFLHASAAAKLLNLASNVAALLLFAYKGHIWWCVVVWTAMANVGGSLVGSRLAIRHGAGFVRGVFVVVVSLLIAKTGWDAYF